jgi:glycosyltransferase involved in cell wall biosynthesis
MSDPLVSFLISTHNRRDALLQTLAVLSGPAAGTHPSETIVIDNAGSDGTADAVEKAFPNTRLLRQTVNRGPCAKNLGLAVARGRYIVFLDDDSYPFPRAVDRMVEHFAADPKLGAAIFAVQLPNGVRECSAYPEVFAGCGVGLRATALAEVGGLPEDFFMQAEEYDLSLRLLDAGWGVRRFEDLCVHHLKTQASRFPGRVMRLDVRNNLTLIGRYFPDQWRIPFAADWSRRYRLIAQTHGRLPAYWAGLAAGMARLAWPGNRRPISATAFEAFAKIEQIEQRMDQAAGEFKLKRVLLIDLGKNVLPYWRAASRRGLEVAAVADASLGGRGFSYHGVPILTDDQALNLRFDGAVISNLSPVHARQRRELWRSRTDQPVLDLLEAA